MGLTGEFLRHLRAVRNCSPHTVRAYEGDLAQFTEFVNGEVGIRVGGTADGGLALVRGKGGRERLSPLGSAALRAMDACLSWRSRRLAALGRDTNALFINKNGTRLDVQSVGDILERCGRKAG